MNRPSNMLVETIMERRGERFEAVQPPKGQKAELFKKVPNLVPVGVVVGVNDSDCIRIGWSKENEIDRAKRLAAKEAFNLDQGVAFACQRMLDPKPAPVGRGFARHVAKFEQRCVSYFKDAKFIQRNGVITSLPPKVVAAKSDKRIRAASAEAKLASLLGMAFVNGIVNIDKSGSMPTSMSGSVRKAVASLCKDPNCPVHGVRKGMGVKQVKLPTTLPVEIQKLEDMISAILGPVKIVDLLKIG